MFPTYEGIVQQGRIRLPAGTALPEGVRVLVTVLPAVDEIRARRTANRWLAENVGDMVMANQATLVMLADDRQAWRFGAFVTSSSRDPFGPIGYVEVDTGTGAVLTDNIAAEEMAQRGERLERAPLSTGG